VCPEPARFYLNSKDYADVMNLVEQLVSLLDGKKMIVITTASNIVEQLVSQQSISPYSYFVPAPPKPKP
jgi:hypothetical protein